MNIRVNLYLDKELREKARKNKLNLSRFTNTKLAEHYGIQKKWVKKQ